MAKSIKHYLFVSRLDTLFLVSTAKMLTTTATAQMGYSNTTPHCATLSLDKVLITFDNCKPNLGTAALIDPTVYKREASCCFEINLFVEEPKQTDSIFIHNIN